jgi:hypothetical protein
MEEPVQDGGGQDLIAEDRAPLRHHLIGGDQQAAALVAPRDQLEEEMGAAPLEGQIAELVDDQQLRLGEKHQPVGELTIGLGPRERAEERGRTDEEDRVPRFDDGAPEGDRQMRLADAGWAEDQDVFRLRKKSTGGQLADEALIDGTAGI